MRTPRAWCLRILDALGHRTAPGHEASTLEMLLSYFIQLDPTPEEFATGLSQHVTSTRPSVAEAAWVLQRSWLRGDWALEAPPAPPLAETLRAVGAQLDEAATEAAYLAVTADGARLQAFGATDVLDQGLAELWHEIAARTALRGQLGAADLAAPERYETRLRAVGTELDRQPAQEYRLLVSRHGIVVEGSAGYYGFWSDNGRAPQIHTAQPG